MAGLNDQPVKDPVVANDPKLEAEQLKNEVVEVEPEIITPAVEVPVVAGDPELEALTVKQLQEVVTKMGFVGADAFTTKKQLLNVISNLKAKPSLNAGAVTAPDKTATVTEAKNWEGKRERTKKYMETQPTVRTMIPLDLGEVRGAVAELQINGYKLIVPKGVYCNLPEPFADLVAYSFNQTADAGKDFLLDRPGKDAETGKTVAEILG